MSNEIPVLTLRPKEDRRLVRGHLWAYRNEFTTPPKAPDGTIVRVTTNRGRHLATGFYQAEGGIAVRVLTREKEIIDAALLRHRVQRARAFREKLYPGSDVYRWVHGESDGLPGFVADRFGAVVSVQTSCTFYKAYCEALAEAFLEAPGVEGVRLEIASRAEWYGRPVRPLEIELDGARFEVDVDSGQKTGMYLDQRENALELRRFAKDARILDGHCYIGMWSCHAALAGAKDIIAVDSSAPAIQRAEDNADRNGVASRCQFLSGDIAEFLEVEQEFDIVTIDPPALAKSRGQVTKAMAAYQRLNRAAMRRVKPGGLLVTSSCSHFVDHRSFMEMLKRTARSEGRDAWVVSERGAARDHPVLLAMPETQYLSCTTLRMF